MKPIEEQSPMTYGALKDFLDSLTDEQLSQKVMLWGEEECRRLLDGEVLSENYYYSLEDSYAGCFPMSYFTDDPDDPTELAVAHKSGTVVLHLEF